MAVRQLTPDEHDVIRTFQRRMRILRRYLVVYAVAFFAITVPTYFGGFRIAKDRDVESIVTVSILLVMVVAGAITMYVCYRCPACKGSLQRGRTSWSSSARNVERAWRRGRRAIDRTRRLARLPSRANTTGATGS